MATIQTMIELYDAFSSPMMDVINSVNLGLSAIHDLHQTMSAPVDMAALDGARDSITQAAAAEETNAKFESMPMTWAQVWTSFENHALLAFEPVLQRMNEISNHEDFQQFVNRAIDGLALLAGVALQTFDLLTSATGAVADHWSMLAPIIWGVVAALVVYNATLAVVAVVTSIVTAAQRIFNAVLYACPLIQIIAVIFVLITVFYEVIAAVNHFAGTSISATGIICGAFAVAGAAVANIFIALNNVVINIFVAIWNRIADVANFLATAFNDPASAAARTFYNMVDACISMLQPLANAIDAIFGTNLAGKIADWRSSIGDKLSAIQSEPVEVMQHLNASDYAYERISFSDAWEAGNRFGRGIEDKVKGWFSAGDTMNVLDYGGALDGLYDSSKDTAANTAAMAKTLEFTAEELRYMRDIAEREAINRFTTAEIHIQQNNENHISSDMDVDGIMNAWTDYFSEEMDIAREGVSA